MTDAPSPERVKRMTICNGCKFAEWMRTSIGALHPSGAGQCTYAVTVPAPASSAHFPAVEIYGRGIERTNKYSETWLSECPVREVE